MTLSRPFWASPRFAGAWLAGPSLALVCLAAAPAWAQDARASWSAIGQGAGVLVGNRAPGGDRGSAHGGYGLRGELETITPTGLTFGAVAILGSGDHEKSLDRPGTNEAVTLSEVYVSARAVYGEVRVGDDDGAAKRAVDLLPLLVGGQMDGFWTLEEGARPPASFRGRDSDDGTKILVQSPRLFGLRLGASYALQRESLVEDLREADNLTAEDDFWEVGINYRGETGPISYELAGGLGGGDAGEADVADTRVYKLGGLLTYAGFLDVGVLWFDDGDSARPAGRGLETSGITVQTTYRNNAYGATLFANHSGTDNEQQYRAVGLGLSWQVRREVTLGLDLIRYRSDFDPSVARPDQRSTLGQFLAEVRF